MQMKQPSYLHLFSMCWKVMDLENLKNKKFGLAYINVKIMGWWIFKAHLKFVKNDWDDSLNL